MCHYCWYEIGNNHVLKSVNWRTSWQHTEVVNFSSNSSLNWLKIQPSHHKTSPKWFVYSTIFVNWYLFIQEMRFKIKVITTNCSQTKKLWCILNRDKKIKRENKIIIIIIIIIIIRTTTTTTTISPRPGNTGLMSSGA